VTLTAADQVVGITLDSSGPRVIARLPTVRQPDTVAADPATGRLYVTGTHDGVLQILGPVRTPK
jgi:DNA-binding beta-propeller fold protein YncE